MIDIGFWTLVGTFIGWNLPQPFWAVWIQTKITELAKAGYEKIKNKV